MVGGTQLPQNPLAGELLMCRDSLQYFRCILYFIETFFARTELHGTYAFKH